VMGRVLEFFLPPPTGDFDDDGVVDGADFLAWQRNVGAAAASRGQGDANGDGEVDAADLAVWQAEFGGESIALPVAAMAPQPQPLQPSSAPQPTAVEFVSLAQHAAAVLGAAVVAEPRTSFRPAIRETPRLPAWQSVIREALAPESAPDQVQATQMPRRDEPPGGTQNDAEAADIALDQLAEFSWRDVRRY